MRVILLTTAMIAFSAAGSAHGAPTKIVDGICEDGSHIAEGPIGADLSSRRARFFCDTLVMRQIGDGKILMQFAEKGAVHGHILGFAGRMASPAMMRVDHIYLEDGSPTVANDGVCKFFFEGTQKITSVMCAAKADEEGRRTVPVVVFKARSAF